MDEEELDLERTREEVPKVELFIAFFDKVRALLEEDRFWETLEWIRDSEDLNREGEMRVFPDT